MCPFVVVVYIKLSLSSNKPESGLVLLLCVLLVAAMVTGVKVTGVDVLPGSEVAPGSGGELCRRSSLLQAEEIHDEIQFEARTTPSSLVLSSAKNNP